MRAFTRVVYGIIDVQLSSALHIGSGNDRKESEAQEPDIMVDGEGHYILPGTAIAGVSLHYIRNLYDSSHEDAEAVAALDLMGNPLHARRDTHQESSVYYYDAICDHVAIEQRTGVGINHARGVAQVDPLTNKGHLFKNLFISPGMTASLRLQIFAADEKEAALGEWIVSRIAQGYHTGKIAMGMRTSSGAGRFTVTDVRTMTVDLTTRQGLDQYLEGVETCFARVVKKGIVIPTAQLLQNTYDHIDTYSLKAFCPEGLLVRSAERKAVETSRADADNVAVNMFYTQPQDGNDNTEPAVHYFIPGTTIKGILRTYAERVYSVMGLDSQELDYLFGTTRESEGEKHKSCIHTFDTELTNATPKMHNRIKLDRVLGDVIEGAKAEEELLYIIKEPLDLQVQVDGNLLADAPDPERLQQRAEAILFLAMRDLGTGRVTIGSGGGIGHGRLCGETLTINGTVCRFTDDQIDCRDQTEEIKTWLRSLGGGAQ